MNWIEAIILRVVQARTEFFPVSSSGHLVMTEQLLGLALPGIGFEVALLVAGENSRGGEGLRTRS